MGGDRSDQMEPDGRDYSRSKTRSNLLEEEDRVGLSLEIDCREESTPGQENTARVDFPRALNYSNSCSFI